jgi:cytochrome c heme-lyase
MRSTKERGKRSKNGNGRGAVRKSMVHLIIIDIGADWSRCGGPRLHSFLGLSTTMSPKARFNTLLGYTAPFDRHDWVVDRCGTRVEYVIDFYAGRDDGKGNGKLNFYLDVRPKLNTWEGWKMRGARALGLA